MSNIPERPSQDELAVGISSKVLRQERDVLVAVAGVIGHTSKDAVCEPVSTAVLY